MRSPLIKKTQIIRNILNQVNFNGLLTARNHNYPPKSTASRYRVLALIKYLEVSAIKALLSLPSYLMKSRTRK